jgi:hypothetical protein
VRDPLKFKKRGQLYIAASYKPLSVVAMRVNNPDCLPVGINRGDAAPTPTGCAELVCNYFPVLPESPILMERDWRGAMHGTVAPGAASRSHGVVLLADGLRRVPQLVNGFAIGNRMEFGETVERAQRDDLIRCAIAGVQPERLKIQRRHAEQPQIEAGVATRLR